MGQFPTAFGNGRIVYWRQYAPAQLKNTSRSVTVLPVQA